MSDSLPIREAIALLELAGIPSPRNDAELLLEHATTTDVDFAELISRRSQRIPLQHLTGTAYFRFLDLRVGPGVFIPRPETELLAQVGIDALQSAENKIAVELCAGSGAIAISLATEVAGSTVYAVEKSAEAFEWLKKNANDYSDVIATQGSTLQIIHGDATELGELASLTSQVDVVLSNPPYIPDAMVPKEPEVRDHDPHIALFGGSDGFDIARGVINVAHQLLVPGGVFGMEHADVQGESVKDLLQGWQEVIDHQDYNHLPRYVTARLASS